MTRLTDNKPLGYEDMFGKAIADSTRNKLDIGAHYPYSPERWRVFVDGSRVFPEYGSVSQYNHATDMHELSPAQGETVTFETAERLRYVVQYELEITGSFSINRALQSGDKIEFGLYDGSDGWIIEQNDTHTLTQATLKTFRASTEQTTREITLPRGFDKFVRYSLRSGWYRVTRQLWSQSYPEGGVQQNPELGQTSLDDGTTKGPATGNLPIHFSVTRGASSDALTLSAGSVAAVIYGGVAPISRTKHAFNTRAISGTNQWEPLLALRVDPNRDVISAQLTGLRITEFSGSGDVKLSVNAHDPSKVLEGASDPLDDADFSTPEGQTATNSVIEEAIAVTRGPDTSGSTTTAITSGGPGGFQIGYASLYSSGKGASQTERDSPFSRTRPIYGRDTAIVWGKATVTGNVTFEWITEQEW